MSVKYKDREVDRRGPGQHVGDECIAGCTSVYDFECSTNVICLFIPYSAFEQLLNTRSKAASGLILFVKNSRKLLRIKVLDLFKEEYEANILNQGQLIGEFIEEFNRDKQEAGLRKRTAKKKTKMTVIEFGTTSMLQEKDSLNKMTTGSQKMMPLTLTSSIPQKILEEDKCHIQPQDLILNLIRHPDTYKKSMEIEVDPSPEPLLEDTDSSELEGSKLNGLDEDDLAVDEAVPTAEPEPDPNVTVDDSALMARPVASMAAADLTLRLEASLEMAEVYDNSSGKT